MSLFTRVLIHADILSRLFDRAANNVGLDFLAHPFWDKYIEFEERSDSQDKIFGILSRIISIPLHQYARYFERYRQLAASQPVVTLAPGDVLQQYTADLQRDLGPKGGNSYEFERELRARLDQYHLETFNRTQAETNKRWTYEQEVKRPYFHVTELEEAQLANWQKYLDFEESEGDYKRTVFLYERCLVTAAQYDDFWHRYARWMYAQDGKQEEVRNIFERASCIYVPIAQPSIRVQWALFEEICDRPNVSAAIYEAILVAMPGYLQAIVNLANLQRRQAGYDAAIAVYQQYIDGGECSTQTKGSLISEMARLAWQKGGDAEEGRIIFQNQQQRSLDSQPFWNGYLAYELDQPTSQGSEVKQYNRIKSVHDDIRTMSRLPADAVKELSQQYMTYLTQRGGKAATREYMDLDAEVNGPASIIPIIRNRSLLGGKSLAGRPGGITNGHAS